MNGKAHGSQKFTQFTHRKSSETDHYDVDLYHGYRYPPNGPYDSYTHTHRYFTGFPIADNDEAFPSSIWVSTSAQPLKNQAQVTLHPCINQNEAFQENYNSHTFGGRDGQKSLMITYHAPYKRMTIHFPKVPRHGDLFWSYRIDNVLFLDNVSRINPWDHRMLLSSSGYPRERDLYRVHEACLVDFSVSPLGILLMRTSDYVLSSPDENRSLTCYLPAEDVVIHYTKFPRDGDIFYSRQNDNVTTLDIVQVENAVEYHCPDSSVYPRNQSLYRAYKADGKLVLQRMADDILVFHEENETATYYLLKKDIVLHFTKVPRDGDIFCSQRNDNVVILDTLPVQTSQEHHIKNSFVYPWDRDLYCVHKRNGGFLLMKLEDNDMPSEESYCLSEIIYDGNSTFTCYLNYRHMAFHFDTFPTDGDFFRSYLKNNIMILEVYPRALDDHPTKYCSYGHPLDVDFYCVKQRDAGFELVKIRLTDLHVTCAHEIRLRLKVRRYVVSRPSENNVCAICMVSYKKFDRIGKLHCGHEYHVSCITTWLAKKNLCPYCRGEGPTQRTKYLCVASASYLPTHESHDLLNLSI